MAFSTKQEMTLVLPVPIGEEVIENVTTETVEITWRALDKNDPVFIVHGEHMLNSDLL